MAPPTPGYGYGYPQSGYPQSGGYPQPSGYTHDDPPPSGYPGSQPAKPEPEPEKPSSRWHRDEDRPARGSNKREDAAFKKATYLVKLDGEGVFDAEGTAIPPVIGG